MAERLKAHAWKACVLKGTVGSNPTLSAIQSAGAETCRSPHGESPTVWNVSGAPDLEAVALADPTSSLVYLGVEHPDGVLEFDLSSALGPLGCSR